MSSEVGTVDPCQRHAERGSTAKRERLPCCCDVWDEGSEAGTARAKKARAKMVTDMCFVWFTTDREVGNDLPYVGQPQPRTRQCDQPGTFRWTSARLPDAGPPADARPPAASSGGRCASKRTPRGRARQRNHSLDTVRTAWTRSRPRGHGRDQRRA